MNTELIKTLENTELNKHNISVIKKAFKIMWPSATVSRDVKDVLSWITHNLSKEDKNEKISENIKNNLPLCKDYLIKNLK